MEITIHEVAQKANVSVSTASRILNGGTKGLRRDAAERARQVLDAAQALGYRPNTAARSLVMKRSFNIGFVGTELNNPVRGRLLEPLRAAALAKGFQLLVSGVKHSGEVGQGLENMLNQRIEGLVLGNIQEAALPFLEKVVQGKLPVVGFGQERGMPWDSVVIDYNGMTAKLTSHLINHHGLRRVAFVGPACRPSRLQGYEEAMINAGLRDRIDVWDTRQWSLEAGRQLVCDFIDSGRTLPQALVCNNDLCALGIMAGLRSRGVRVPGDIAVTGLDNIEFAAYSNPSLTTAGVDSDELAFKLFEMLLQRIEKEHQLPPRYIHCHEPAFLRESCGCREHTHKSIKEEISS